MNIVFFGSSNFAVPTLKALLTSRHKVGCVLTQPDRQKGRGLHFAGTAIKTVALEAGIRIHQPENVNGEDAQSFLKDLKPDLFVVIAYGQILASRILNIPKIFSINVHGSLLPKYRGAAPINWAIIRGEKTTGITIIKMTEEMDGGEMLSQKAIEIENCYTAISLENKLSDLATGLLLETIDSIENNNYKLTPQDGGNISFAPKLKKADGQINWDKPAQDIYNLIRGCINWPGAFTYYNGKLLKIYKARLSMHIEQSGNSPSGEIIGISKEGIVVATPKENLVIEELQSEGKKRMKIAEFITGHKISIGEKFYKK